MTRDLERLQNGDTLPNPPNQILTRPPTIIDSTPLSKRAALTKYALPAFLLRGAQQFGRGLQYAGRAVKPLARSVGLAAEELSPCLHSPESRPCRARTYGEEDPQDPVFGGPRAQPAVVAGQPLGPIPRSNLLIARRTIGENPNATHRP